MSTSLAKNKLYKLDEILDEYEKSIGLPQYSSPGTEDELNQYLSMSRDELEKLTPEVCSHLVYRLSQYAFYLKRLFNREKTRVIWARQELMNIVAKASNSYDKFTKFDVKVSLITNDDEYAMSLQKILTYAEERVQRLEELAIYIKHLSDSMKNMQAAKIQLLRNA